MKKKSKAKTLGIESCWNIDTLYIKKIYKFNMYKYFLVFILEFLLFHFLSSASFREPHGSVTLFILSHFYLDIYWFCLFGNKVIIEREHDNNYVK